jgi:hypothetical protein
MAVHSAKKNEGALGGKDGTEVDAGALTERTSDGKKTRDPTEDAL